ncbi:MAG: putative photosynthetic complex assembly protein PuhE [Rubrivivax sp.]
MDYVLPPLVALFVWWFGTGVVMLLDGLPRSRQSATMAAATGLALLALAGVVSSAQHTGPSAAYLGFVCAVGVWAWHELSLLTGWLTGPRRTACSVPAHAPTRFREAVQAILWHELAIIATGVLIVALTWNAPNPVAAWTFALLWVMRLSAKLNLFLGVRNLGQEFLPPHLLYLGSYFRRARMNALLPLSLLAGSAVAAGLLQAAAAAGADARTALLLVASLLVLALVEHLLMVLPLPPTLLWRWALRTQGLPP